MARIAMRRIERLPRVAAVRIPPLRWAGTLAVFGGAALLLWVGTHGLIPALSHATGVEPILFWFLVGGLGVFTPLLMVAFLLLRQERALAQPRLWSERLRFRKLDRGDWLWGLGALIVIGAATAVLQFALGALLGGAPGQPSFLSLEPLTPERYWILGVWLPFWVLNIMGEEILWRGVLLPRQEVAFGRRAWVVHGLGWTLFHLAFGWQLVVMLLPILFVLPYVVQRRRNSWLGVLIHAGLNGPAFIAVAFGLA